MATYHILNGDCLAEQLLQTKIDKNFIVCRECLIDGDLNADNLADFWNIRANFISNGYQVPREEYFRKTVSEFEKINTLPNHSEVCLWFENDLFCQANMWFVISLLAENHTLNIFRVFPKIENKADTWKGFGIANAEKLEQAFDSRNLFTSEDIELGNHLWASYQSSDLLRLKELSDTQSHCFEQLKEVCQAHIDRFPTDKMLARPDRVMKELIETVSTDFQTVFAEFSNREGIYGFGDSQLKVIYNGQLAPP